MSANLSCLNDQEFGPVVQGCRSDFDFTQFFERTIIWSLPSAIFILVASLRLLNVLKKPRIVSGVSFQITKATVIAIFVALQLALIVASTRSAQSPVRTWTIAGSLLAFAAGAFMLVISFLDHARSARSSALLSGYLLLTLLFDAAQTRTLWNTKAYPLLTPIFTASLAVKVVIFVLELLSKSRWIDQHTQTLLGPEAMSNIFNLASYYWLRRLLWTGFHKILALADLYPLIDDVSAERASQRLQRAISSRTGGLKGNALLLSLFKAFPTEFLLPIIPRAAKVGLRYAQSFLMQSLLRYLSDEDAAKTPNPGYGLIGATALVYGSLAAAFAYRSYFVTRLLSMTRAGLCAILYSKVTEMGPSTNAEAASLTLMSTDVANVQGGLRQIHELWGNTAEVAIGCWLLYRSIGAAFVAPLVVVLVCLFPLALVLVLLGKRQDQWMSKVQSRVGKTSNILSSMRGFKMLGVAEHVGNLLHNSRSDEVHAGNRFRVFQLLTFIIAQTPLAVAAPITFAFTNSDLDTTELFGALSYIILLASPLDTLIQSLPDVVTGMVSLRRIQAFLNNSSERSIPHSPCATPTATATTTEAEETPGSISLPEFKPSKRFSESIFTVRNGTFGWDKEPVLKNISLSISTSSLTIIAGPVASGKSTLCSAMLSEVPFSSGSVESALIDIPVGYCASTPFLWNGTIRENIIGFSNFDADKYNAVLHATMLNADISSLAQGSDTKVGNNGTSISGGQRQRVSLARALYSGADAFIFDDVLSGLDSKTENQVFERVMGRNGFIRRSNATAVFCTHAIRYLPEADHVVILDGTGGIAKQGPPETLDLEQRTWHTTASHEDPESSDEPAADQNKTPSVLVARPNDPFDSSRQMGDTRVYGHYIRNAGRSMFGLLLAVAALAGFATNFSTVWLNFWSADTYSLPRSIYSGLYGGISAFELVATGCAGAVLLLVAVPRIGKRFHASAVNTVMSAPLDLFTHTETGTITNLFSQDMSLIDMDLPLSMINFLVLMMTLIGNLAVVAIPSPYLAISYPFLFGALWALQLGYLRTSRQLRLLDLEAKSPLYNQFLETAQGITTIRSLRWVDRSVEKNNDLLNESQRPAYLLSMSQNFLTTMLNIIIAVLATVLTVLATQLRTNTGFTAVSFITLLNLSSMIATMMQDYTELEISLGAVNRLVTFSQNNPSESNVHTDLMPGKDWPARGEIRIENISAAYKSPTTPAISDSSSDTKSQLALQSISLYIKPGEHVAICGRTGSGKSSFLLILLRLLDPTTNTNNSIQIDNISINRVNRDLLRQRLITIPQDPSFLPAGHTIRENVDLFNEATEEECTEVLEQVNLSKLLKDGINAEFSPETLSHGHQQLFSFARAVLRKKVRARSENVSGGILIMDEPNSKVDLDTDAAMQDIVRTNFGNYTILVISHRLETVMNLCDRVVVLSEGKLVEQGSPEKLKAIKGSWFGNLLEETK
ncbi:hypothetical protein TruAng_009991 [Truncatella angustata]|nr:hypothetical protein TruAng_009991 [Truncatella angustata]